MGQVLHSSATTTEAVRRAIQNSQESLRAPSKRYGIKQKTRCQMEETDLRGRYAKVPESAWFKRAVDRGGGDHCRLLASHAVTPRRLPLLASTNYPTPDTFFIASLPPSPRYR